MHVALDLAAAADVDKFLGCFGNDGIVIVIELLDQRADRRRLPILVNRRIIVRAQPRSAGPEFRQEALVVDVETERLGARPKVYSIDKERDLVLATLHTLLIVMTRTNKSSCVLSSQVGLSSLVDGKH